ncbi:hypothetical protein [Kitasatospora sp. LaBMicrA B282]|uniref:hypothetical protein n=1 Tax=Kitasatospora sp. LaBMicrA B282 TaxID=3420949 RepID=UPI003D0E702D
MWAPPEHHLASGTSGRAARDGYSWRQAAHWVHGAGLHAPTHGPRFGETTLSLVEVLAELTPCRPSISFLMRKLGCSRRTVQYHLEILRSTGLLAWRSIGTRLPMMPGQQRVTCLASEYERLIPRSYDQALGIRTAGEGLERRMTGISDEGRRLIAALGKKATGTRRRTRRPRHRTRTGRAANSPRCTPMEGGTTHCVGSSSVGDQKTTGRARDSKPSTGNQQRPKRRTVLDQVVTAAMLSAADQLARTAYQRVPWVRRASHDQLRWVLNDLATRGWTEQQTMTWLAEIAAHYGNAGLLWRPERPHALIAHSLRQEADQAAHDLEAVAQSEAAVRPNEAFTRVLTELRAAERADPIDGPLNEEVTDDELRLLRKTVWYDWKQHRGTAQFEIIERELGPSMTQRIFGPALYHHLRSYLSGQPA